MHCLLFSGETPDHGGYQVAWHSDAPGVKQCRPELDRVYIHDWSRQQTHARRPEVERLSWRAVDSDGVCRVRQDAVEQTRSESAWLAAADLQLERGDLRAGYRDALLFLIAGCVRLELDDAIRELMRGAGDFLDYKLYFLGPDGERLAEDPELDQGHFRFLEKNEAFLVAS